MFKKYASFLRADIAFLGLIALYPLFLGGNRPFPSYFFGLLLTINCFWTLSHYSLDIFQAKTLRIAAYAAFSLLCVTLLNALFIAPNFHYALSGWAVYFSYFMVFIQTLFFTSRKGFFTSLLKVIGYSGFLYSLYGLAMTGLGYEKILFYDKVNYIGSVTSTYINRNHFALFAVFSFLALFTLFLEKMKKEDILGTTKLSIMGVRFLGFLAGNGVFLFIKLCIVLTTILLTGSRSGMILVIFGTAMMVLGRFFKNRNVLSSKKITAIIVTILILFSASFIGFSSKTIDRLHYTGASLSERYAVWDITSEMIKDKPLLGHGLKNFEFGFQSYQDYGVSLNKRWDKAHNDYLEFIAEFGIPIGVFFFGFMGWMCRLIVKSMLQRRRLYNDNLFVMSVMCVIALHSFVDFGMQMPANSVIFIALLSAAFARSIRRY